MRALWDKIGLFLFGKSCRGCYGDGCNLCARINKKDALKVVLTFGKGWRASNGQVENYKVLLPNVPLKNKKL